MNVVTYGSLAFPEIMRALLERDFDSEMVTLTGFARFVLIGKRYPGLIRSAGSVVTGRLYFDLDPESVEILDRFEDEIYQREIIKISSSRGLVEARAYIISPAMVHTLSGSPWSPDEFERAHLADFIAMCRRFRLSRSAADVSSKGIDPEK